MIAKTQKNIKNTWKIKKQYKKTIKDKNNSFLCKALSSKNPKTVWNSIDRILNKQQKRINNEPSKMSNYFSNLAANLTNKENTESNFTTLLNNLPDENCDQSFHLNRTNCNEVYKIITNLKNDCSSGHDNIPVRYLKSVAEYVTSPMMHITNTSIDQEIFAEQWNISRVCPIPKTDNPTSIKDYRPISVLSVLSKVYKRVILNQLGSFIETQNLYNINQSGFRKGHPTNMLLLKLRDDIKTEMNRSEVALSLLTDYSKAFDTIDHRISLEKLQNMNFAKNTIICSYLIERYQNVQIEDKRSTLLPMFFGAPQGSILFNLYIAELADRIYSTTIQYADDTTLYRHCKISNLHEFAVAIQKDVEKLQSWSQQNNLIFNCDKLQSVLFSSS